MKILVRSPNWIGDQVLAFPFFYHLRAKFPKAEIVVSCVEWVESLQYRKLVDRVVPLPKSNGPGLGSRLRSVQEAGEELRALGPWDAAYSLPNSFSAAWILKRAGARERHGYTGDARGWLLTHKADLKVTAKEHRSHSYCRLLGTPELRTIDFWGQPPRSEHDSPVPGVLPKFDLGQWESNASEKRLGAPDFPYWILAPGSTAETRRWPREMFAELARLIHAQTGWMGLVVGGAREAPLAQWLIEQDKGSIQDWTGQGSVADYANVFEGARFAVANDSGLAHVASLLGCPVGIVWGGGDPVRTRPMGPGRVKLVFNGVDCWPCERNSCALPEGRKIECLRGIDPQNLWKEIADAFRVQ